MASYLSEVKAIHTEHLLVAALQRYGQFRKRGLYKRALHYMKEKGVQSTHCSNTMEASTHKGHTTNLGQQ